MGAKWGRRFSKSPQFRGMLAAGAYRGFKTISGSKKPLSIGYLKKRSVPGVTRQHDFQNQYKRKRMPYRKKKSWVKFVKKVRAVNAKEEGTKTVLFNASNISEITTSDSQQYKFVSLYGRKGSIPSTEIGSNDLSYIFSNGTESSLGAQKLTFKSAVLDMTVSNTGTNKVELDLYVLTFWGDATSASFNDCLSAGASDTPLLNPNADNYFGALNLGRRGCTPFELPNFIRNAKCTIQKKTKYFIPNGDTFTYQIRDAKEHHISEVSVQQDGTPAIKGLTQCLLMVWKPVVGSSTTGNEITLGVTRKYSFTSEDDQDQSGYKAV